MWQTVIVIFLVVLAAAGLAANAWRQLKGKGGCSCASSAHCQIRNSCKSQRKV